MIVNLKEKIVLSAQQSMITGDFIQHCCVTNRVVCNLSFLFSQTKAAGLLLKKDTYLVNILPVAITSISPLENPYESRNIQLTCQPRYFVNFLSLRDSMM